MGDQLFQIHKYFFKVKARHRKISIPHYHQQADHSDRKISIGDEPYDWASEFNRYLENISSNSYRIHILLISTWTTLFNSLKTFGFKVKLPKETNMWCHQQWSCIEWSQADSSRQNGNSDWKAILQCQWWTISISPWTNAPATLGWLWGIYEAAWYNQVTHENMAFNRVWNTE